MHGVELAFKLEPQFDLFLVILCVLHVLFLQFQPQLLFIRSIFLELVVIVSHRLHVLLEDFLSVEFLLNFRLEHRLDLVHLPVVLVRDLGDQDPVVRLAAVLEQDLVHFPDSRDDLVIPLRRCQDFL